MKKNEKIVLITCVAIVLLGFGFMFTGGISLPKKDGIKVVSSNEVPTATGTTNEINRNIVVEQTFINKEDTIKQIAVVFYKVTEYEKKDDFHVNISLYDGDTVLANKWINVVDVESQHRTFVNLNQTYTSMKDKELTLVITGDDDFTGLLLMMQENDVSKFKFGNMTINGTVCFSIN